MSFSSQLRKYRKKAGVSQKELAHIVGLDPSYLSKIEHDRRTPPDRSVVIEIANTLELQEDQIDQLLTAAGYQPLTLFDLGFDQNDLSLKKHINILSDIKKKAPLAAYIRAKEEISEYLDTMRFKYTQKIDPDYFKKNLLANYLYSQVRRLGLKELYRLINRPLGGAFVLHKGKLLLQRIGISPIKGWWHIPIGFVNPKKGDKNAQDIATRLVKRCVLDPKKRNELVCKVEKELTAPSEVLEDLDTTWYSLRLGVFPSVAEIFEISLNKPELIANSDQSGWFEVKKLDQLKGDVHPLLFQIIELYFKDKKLARVLKKRGEEAIAKVISKKDYVQKMQEFARERITLIE
jgi:transcriptional regulator with XRE-family HTH domain